MQSVSQMEAMRAWSDLSDWPHSRNPVHPVAPRATLIGLGAAVNFAERPTEFGPEPHASLFGLETNLARSELFRGNHEQGHN
jgi:hypothetical protein